MNYSEFLASKALSTESAGFEPTNITAPLFPFQRDIVRIACLSGRFCIWADCGMGKTPMQLEWASQVCQQTGGRVLILAPLAVSHQTIREAQKFGIEGVKYASRSDWTDARITVTNYQKLQHFNSADYAGVVIDESSILKSMDGKTRTAIIEAFAKTPYRLACSATPAPNDYMELGNHAEFLGIMSRVEMLSMFFVHDGGDTAQWRLKGHAESAFWAWVCSWAATLRKPSDLGYVDDGFLLPLLNLIDHVVETPQETTDSLFVEAAQTLSDQRKIQRLSLPLRVAEAVALANGNDEQWLIWCHLNDESSALTAGIRGAVEVKGSDADAHKEQSMLRFQEGKIRVLVSKSSICGFGMNFQCCHNVAFVGLSHSYEAFYQAVRRSWRFGQQHPVNAHIIYDKGEGTIIQNTRRKERDADHMAEKMVLMMREKTMEQLQQVKRQTASYATRVEEGRGWQAYLGDCVESIAQLNSDSIHYSIFSPPFASLYTYSNSDRDMGNCKNHEDFGQHFQFLVRELYRVIMPGRLVSFHCMNLPKSKTRDGIIGVRDFRGELIRAFEGWNEECPAADHNRCTCQGTGIIWKDGFVFHSEVCIWKDPVTAMQRTKAIGLLHKQVVKDSAMSRQGIPDYLVTMRKPGTNHEPVVGKLDMFVGEEGPNMGDDPVRNSINIWQRYASPVWMDINPSNTLQFRSARANDDERHICPLQLDVIRRGMQLWTNPGDVVLDPFGGIGSTGVIALEMDRAAVLFELKESYYDALVKNMQVAETEANTQTLFSSAEV